MCSFIPRCPEPDCAVSFSAAACRDLLSAADWDVLQELQAEESIPQSRRLYCADPACSALIVLPNPPPAHGVATCSQCNKCACCKPVLPNDVMSTPGTTCMPVRCEQNVCGCEQNVFGHCSHVQHPAAMHCTAREWSFHLFFFCAAGSCEQPAATMSTHLPPARRPAAAHLMPMRTA